MVMRRHVRNPLLLLPGGRHGGAQSSPPLSLASRLTCDECHMATSSPIAVVERPPVLEALMRRVRDSDFLSGVLPRHVATICSAVVILGHDPSRCASSDESMRDSSNWWSTMSDNVADSDHLPALQLRVLAVAPSLLPAELTRLLAAASALHFHSGVVFALLSRTAVMASIITDVQTAAAVDVSCARGFNPPGALMQRLREVAEGRGNALRHVVIECSREGGGRCGFYDQEARSCAVLVLRLAHMVARTLSRLITQPLQGPPESRRARDALSAVLDALPLELLGDADFVGDCDLGLIDDLCRDLASSGRWQMACHLQALHEVVTSSITS